METYLLHMGKTQMLQAWNNVDFDQYREILGNDFHDKIKQLYAKLESVDVDAIPEAEHSEFMEYFELIKDWSTLLHYHKVDSFPEELVYTLKLLVREWLDDYGKYIILISDNPYMVSYPPSSLDAIYQNIESRYAIHFEEKIVKICMPIEHCSDYLVNVCLYHEVGHFIDRQKNLSFIAFHNIDNLVNSNPGLSSTIKRYFPYYNHPISSMDGPLQQKLYNQLIEYFADIFSAQYNGDGVIMYLGYLHSHEMDKEDNEHPSTQLRYDMISDFMGAGNIITQLFSVLVTSLYKNRTKLRVKFNNGRIADLGSLSLVHVNNEDELHSLYAIGWELYKMDRVRREADYPATSGLSYHDLYVNINRTIKQSVEDFSKNNPFA